MVKQFEELTDSQWEVIKDLFDEQEYCELDLRTVLNVIFWVLRTGCQWRNIDSSFPKWQSVYYHFDKWKKDGRFELMNERLNKLERLRQNRNSKPSMVLTDSQSVKISSFIEEETGYDGGKKIKGRKRHIVTDTLGLVIGVFVTSASQTDGACGVKLFSGIERLLVDVKKVLADGKYGGVFQEYIDGIIDVELEISSRPPTAQGFVPIKFRWVVERTFGWFNFFRRLSKDYEKTPESSAAFVVLANCAVILNRMA